MARRVYSEEFRIEAVKQVNKNGYSISDIAERVGIHLDSLRSWIKRPQHTLQANSFELLGKLK